MGSLSLPKLPVVDLSDENLKPGTSSWLSTCNDIRQALELYGCFEAVYNKVSLELHNEMFSVVEEIFDLPIEIKMKNTDDKPYFGYVGEDPISRPLYESVGIDYANTLEGIQNFTNRLWAEGNDRFCKTALSYSKLVSELEQLVKKMVFESYGVEKYYDYHIETSTYLFRFMKYSAPEMNGSNIGCGNHTDKGYFSILHQNEVNALEIETKDGDWIRFEPSSPSSFIVMAADALLAWINGWLHSPYHRVIMTGNKARYSVGLFSTPEAGYIIKAPEELVDEEHPLLFKPFDYGKFLKFYETEEGLKAKNALETYCGV